MSKIVVWMQVSLDGKAQGPEGEFDWPVVKDELNSYFVHPVTLGGGPPLFPSPAERQGFSLRESRIFDDTVVGLRYARARA